MNATGLEVILTPLSDEPPLLFVYGTLRSGGNNDIARLVPAARFESPARLRGILYDLGDYPALAIDATAGWVTGEIYRIPADGWPALDALEDVVDDARPDGEYFRVLSRIEAADGATYTCQVYVANPAKMRLARVIADGDWMVFAKARTPGS